MSIVVSVLIITVLLMLLFKGKKKGFETNSTTAEDTLKANYSYNDDTCDTGSSM